MFKTLTFQQINGFHELLKENNMTLVTSAVISDTGNIKNIISMFKVGIHLVYTFIIIFTLSLLTREHVFMMLNMNILMLGCGVWLSMALLAT